MIKALVKTPGSTKQLLWLGLTTENLVRLQANEPIMFDGLPFGFAGDIVISHGHTTDDIVEDLRSLGIDTDTLLKGTS